MKPAYLIYSFFFILGSTAAYSQAGNIDTEFGGGDGLVTTNIYPQSNSAFSGVAVQPDGKIIVTGGTNVPGGLTDAVIMRMMPDGSFDNTFNGSGKIMISNPDSDGYGNASIVQSDGKIVILVELGNDQLDSFALHRFLPDGTPDNSFDNDGVVYTNFGTRYLGATALALQPDGKLLVGGNIQAQTDTFNQFYITRFLPNGALDHSFDGDGKAVTLVGEGWGGVGDIVLQPDGKIISVGYCTIDGKEKFAIVRYKANGSLDETFSSDGITTVSFSNQDDYATGVALQSDGKIVVVGLSGSNNGNSDFAACRLTTSGDPDHTFHGDGLVTVPVSIHPDGAYDVLIQPDGKILIGGSSNANPQTGSDMAIVRLTETGIPDFTFDGDGVVVFPASPDNSDWIENMAFQPDGKIVVAGIARFGYYNDMAVARFNTGITVSTDYTAAPDLQVALFPNPVIDDIVVNYKLENSENIGINLYDAGGKMIQTLMTSESRNAGQHSEKLHIKGTLIPGTYFLNIESGHWVKSLKVIVE